MDALEKAFDFASDLTKQLITLSTGIIALTVTFSKDILSTEGASFSGLLIASWICYILCILFGIWTLMALTGTLEPTADNNTQTKPSIRGRNVILPSVLQIVTFLAGIILTVIYAVKAL